MVATQFATYGTPSLALRWFRGELVGKGSMGSVYVAVNADSGRLLVVKQIEVPSLAANRDSGEHRMRKAEMANALRTRTEKFRGVDHSNVVRFIGSENAPSSQRM
jgi:serine/threonine protein kinase